MSIRLQKDYKTVTKKPNWLHKNNSFANLVTILSYMLIFLIKRGTICTEKAGNPDFSGLPAFFVTNLLLVQCSI